MHHDPFLVLKGKFCNIQYIVKKYITSTRLYISLQLALYMFDVYSDLKVSCDLQSSRHYQWASIMFFLTFFAMSVASFQR